eukprot:m.689101 g.689101  ORF g.689101 m.689101 type:complete len:673 (+) comp22846_c0_seq14:395-2413(+)
MSGIDTAIYGYVVFPLLFLAYALAVLTYAHRWSVLALSRIMDFLSPAHVASLVFVQGTNGDAATDPVGLVMCDSITDPSNQYWKVDRSNGAQSTIALQADATKCFVLSPTASGVTCDPNGAGCITLGNCGTAPTWSVKPIVGDKRNQVTLVTELHGTLHCLDFFADKVAQAYPCVGSSNQKWQLNGSAIRVFDMSPEPAFLSLASTGNCTRAVAPTVPPNPDMVFCPKYHPVHDKNVYDPSGPLLDYSGVWHTWEDDGGWSHWTSTDLIHWNGSFTDSTHFSGDTGSVSPTPSGVYAFWPILGGQGPIDIGSAVSTDTTRFTTWDIRGPTIPQPTRITTGYRDPVRAFQYNEKWWVGVGCGNNDVGAQFCLFEADDDTLQNFTDRGSLYSTNITFGTMDDNIVWQPQNSSANMMECPDFFPLGPDGKWVLIGSLYKTNQWWVGTVTGDPPRFTPENVGIVDYGNGYAAKTGTSMVQSGTSRRVVFGFTGWKEPTYINGCGRALVIPRELTVVGTTLHVAPITETRVLRTHQFPHRTVHTTSRSDNAAIIKGSQVEVRLNCTGTWPPSGSVALRTLATADGRSYVEIGYDFAAQVLTDMLFRPCANGDCVALSPTHHVPHKLFRAPIYTNHAASSTRAHTYIHVRTLIRIHIDMHLYTPGHVHVISTCWECMV